MADMFADEDSARFFQMMQMLQRSTLLQMGYLPDQSGTFHYNMGEAREGIEVLRMFQRKTEGNLSDQETQMLRAVISELQMQFTQAPQRQVCCLACLAWSLPSVRPTACAAPWRFCMLRFGPDTHTSLILGCTGGRSMSLLGARTSS